MISFTLDHLAVALRHMFHYVEDIRITTMDDPVSDRIVFYVQCGNPRMTDVVVFDRFALNRGLQDEAIESLLTPIVRSVAKMRWLEAQRGARSRLRLVRNPRVKRGRPMPKRERWAA